MTDGPELILWRHGRTEWNDAGRFQGQLDPPLDEVGHAQAKAAAGELATLRPVSIVSSDLGRARTTAEYLASLTGLPVATDRRLREIDVGQWGGLTRDQVQERFPETYAAWLRGEDVQREGGERLSDVAARAAEAVTEHAVGDGAVVLVTHGGTARALVLSLLGMDMAAWTSFGALGNAHWAALTRGNAHWAALTRGNAGWRLTAYNVGLAVEHPPAGHDDAMPDPDGQADER